MSVNRELAYGFVHIHALTVFKGDDERIGKLVGNALSQSVYLVIVGRCAIGVLHHVVLLEVFHVFQALKLWAVATYARGTGNDLHLKDGYDGRFAEGYYLFFGISRCYVWQPCFFVRPWFGRRHRWAFCYILVGGLRPLGYRSTNFAIAFYRFGGCSLRPSRCLWFGFGCVAGTSLDLYTSGTTSGTVGVGTGAAL